MASWRETVSGPATFRGVPFYVGEVELEGGRRTVRHEFVKRDIPYTEDLGRAGRVFPVEGYVIGEGYLAARDALIGALEAEGPGELVHPYYGKRRVAVSGNFRVRESPNEGGIARFSITFEETEVAPPFPVAVTAASDSLTATVAAAFDAVRAQLDALPDVSLPASYMESIEAVVEDGALAVENALASKITVAQDLAAMRSSMAAIVAASASLALSPADLLEDIVDALDAFVPGLEPRDGVIALIAAQAFTPSVAQPPATTAARVAQCDLYNLALWLIRTALALKAASIAPDAAYDSYDAAVTTRNSILDVLDDLAADAEDDVYALLMQARADLTAAVPGDDSDLPRIERYTPPATVPSLVLAHRLYGDIVREADLVTRNGIERPGFVPGGEELEVLGL